MQLSSIIHLTSLDYVRLVLGIPEADFQENPFLHLDLWSFLVLFHVLMDADMSPEFDGSG